MDRSTKAGARTPATPPRSGRAATSRISLNEGRGANPGDTPRRCASAASPRSAQRRPGREPRRHRFDPQDLHGGVERSTKAGARTPATPPFRHSTSGCPMTLNEGRGANPGDTRQHRGYAVGRLSRSTKAGARTPATPGSVACTCGAMPAQRRPGREPRRHDPRRPRRGGHHPRSTKAGARTPATRSPSCAGRRGSSSLNEGRGANPGDTATTCEVVGVAVCAQRRPGREPRRHPLAGGADAGLPRRSTKAGARTPATRPEPWRARAARCPLNEGRGANPGDTANLQKSVVLGATAVLSAT